MHKQEGQYNYSLLHPRETVDPATRIQKAKKIQAVLLAAIGQNKLSRATVLDIGCSGGIITAYLSDFVGSIVGTDIDQAAIAFAQKNNAERIKKDKLSFHLAVPERIEYPDETFDAVICNMIYEHVVDPALLMSEIKRVLKKEGIVYFGATNRLSVVEPHERLLFLSWMPKFLSNFYLRLAGRDHSYYENLQTLFGLRRLLRGFSITDYTVPIIRDPEMYHAEDSIKPGSLLTRLPLFLFWIVYPLIPTYIWVLKKK